ncbi:hypothetical protein ZYGR_0A02370 [Zygosaccharomyces rouxii]|uniref:Glycerol-3-phosphate dehydrogenase NAD-dependent N-terminal domain-containing protein n=1 Tax=Zygosaccharomyces rouxii TaxID=4956 RepID=A0A1Q2ZTE1_ZYGRO|nr:hypothetical protein ZYGR_0A02370 [Zygosaccharomyces rouxii]
MAATDRLNQTSDILSHSMKKTDTSMSIVTAENPYKVAVVGSGNWGTTIAKVVAENTKEKPELFQGRVDMWVFEEQIDGTPLI